MSELERENGNVIDVRIDKDSTTSVSLNGEQSPHLEEYFPREDRVMYNKLRRISSTSSVYAEYTMSNPNNDEILYCIGNVLQAQMSDDFYDEDVSSLEFPEFDIHVTLSDEYGGDRERIPEKILRHETVNDNELRELLMKKAVPSVDTIFRFFKYIMVLADYSIECNIIALVYINRITIKNHIAVNMRNWRGLWLGAIILAQKVWDDKSLKTSSFSSILSSVSKEALIAAEMKIFALLEYSTTVRPSVYVKYFFELQNLFCEITGDNCCSSKPMTIAEKKRLELRSKRYGRECRKPRLSTSSSSAASKVIQSVTPINVHSSDKTTDVTSDTPVHRTNLPPNHSSLRRAITFEDATYSSLSRYVIN